MATLEWGIPFDITTPRGTLLLNQDLASEGAGWAGRIFQLNAAGCVSRRGIRAVSDPIPQGDGEIFHERFANGYQMKFAVQLWQAEDRIACDEALCEMRDLLYGHIWSLLRPSQVDGGRIAWTPSCGGARILDSVLLLQLDDPQEGERGVSEITFTLDSPFPYAISLFEETVFLAGSGTLSNDGNVDFYPVFRVVGPTSAFTISNDDLGLDYVYSGTTIPGGSYGEIDMFRGGIIYMNGSGANLKSGVDPELSDVLYVEPGGNTFSITGASSDVLMHDAWA